MACNKKLFYFPCNPGMRKCLPDWSWWKTAFFQWQLFFFFFNLCWSVGRCFCTDPESCFSHQPTWTRDANAFFLATTDLTFMQKHPKGWCYFCNWFLSAMMGRKSVFSKRMDAHLSESPPEENVAGKWSQFTSTSGLPMSRETFRRQTVGV